MYIKVCSLVYMHSAAPQRIMKQELEDALGHIVFIGGTAFMLMATGFREATMGEGGGVVCFATS